MSVRASSDALKEAADPDVSEIATISIDEAFDREGRAIDCNDCVISRWTSDWRG